VDQIFQYGRGSKAYKVVSSAAANYDRRLVMTECYGGINNMPVANLYKEVMDQFAKGINLMVPHAVWYETNKIIFQPELSFRTPPYAAELPAYNRYVGRLQRVLQHGHPVVDIGVLYPIAGLQAGYWFGVGTPYEGGVIPPEADYMEIGELLSLRLRQDFTFVHPEVLDGRCEIDGATLRLSHPGWAQRYQVFIVPGGQAIHASNLRKIKAFWDQGGKVIFTTRLPERSAEFGKDTEVQSLCREMLGPNPTGTNGEPGETASSASGAVGFRAARVNARGGRTYFIPKPDARALGAVLAEALEVPDVGWESPPRVSGGNLSCLHKVIDGQEIYFFANSSDSPVETTVRLRGKLKLELWNPHTGQIGAADYAQAVVDRQAVCRLRLSLLSRQSTFIMGERVAFRRD
jgi:hypothetical protein